MSQNHVVIITYGDPETCILTLSDGGETDVDPGDTVTWVIGPNSGVVSITSISDDPNSTDVCNPDPTPFPNGNSPWRGTVSLTIARGSLETYTICWKSASGLIPCCYDPIIKVKP